LNVSFNRIESIDSLNKLPNLKILILNHNKIKKLENLKNLRKLEVLQVSGNLLEDVNIYNSNESMIELKELSVSKNKISSLKLIT
jgi:Leucine-rich repeat (LRR) protein